MQGIFFCLNGTILGAAPICYILLTEKLNAAPICYIFILTPKYIYVCIFIMVKLEIYKSMSELWII